MMEKTNHPNGDRPPAQDSPAREGGHLQYLLTAYLFENLSEPGTREVEAHLAACAECRAELDELRETLGQVEEALGPRPGGEGYSFEARRLERVLAASREKPLPPWLLRKRVWIPLAAAAALVALIGIVVTEPRSSRRSAREVARASLASEVDLINDSAEPQAIAALVPEDARARESSRHRLWGIKPSQEVVPGGAPADRAGERSEGLRRGDILLRDGQLSEEKQPEDKKSSFGVYKLGDLAQAEPQKRGEGPALGLKSADENRGRKPSEATLEKLEQGLEGIRGAGIGGVKTTPEKQKEVAKSVGDLLQRNAPPGAVPPAAEPAGASKTLVLVDDSLSMVTKAETPAKTEFYEVIDHYPAPPLALQEHAEKSAKEAPPQSLSDLVKTYHLPAEIQNNGKLMIKTTPENQAKVKQLLDGLRAAQGAVGYDVSDLIPQGADQLFELVGGLKKEGDGEAENSKSNARDPSKDSKFLHILQRQLSRNGSLEFDAKNKTFIVKDAPENQARVKKLLEEIRAAKDPQVAVESRFLDTQENFLAEIGVDTGAVPADEERLLAYRWARSLDRKLTPEEFQTHLFVVPPPAPGDEGLGEEGFRKRYGVNPFVETARDRLSTFGMDVDTASYTLARDLLRSGKLPDPKQVRVEEFVNYFREEVAADPGAVFSVSSEGGPAPFGEGLDLLKITVKARELRPNEEKAAVLTFAIDVSGSMHQQDRLALVREALKTLVRALKPEDRVAIVAYGSHAYLVLPHTPARESARILGAIDSLAAGGGTNVEAGLELAYRIADEVFERRAVNRVILCSDGVANVGARGPEEMLKKVRVFADRGIYLSAVGFGGSRYNDAMMQTLADRGNGNYAYVDSASAAEEIFRKNLPSTLQVLARDAKVQVDWNPEVVSRYRILGYEKRDVADADFRNDQVDAGEVGPGTTVTVLYEIQRRPGAAADPGQIQLRFLDTGTGRVEEVKYRLAPGVLARSLGEASERFRFIACVAETAELLRSSYWARNGSFTGVLAVLGSLGPEFRARPECQEVLDLVTRARDLTVKELTGK